MRSFLALAILLAACGEDDPVPEAPRAGEIRVCLADCGREGPTVTCLLSAARECPAEIPEWCARARVEWTAPKSVPVCDTGA